MKKVLGKKQHGKQFSQSEASKPNGFSKNGWLSKQSYIGHITIEKS